MTSPTPNIAAESFPNEETIPYYRETPYLEAKLFTNHVVLNNGSIEKPISIMDFISTLEKSFDQNESSLVPLVLPPNTLKIGFNRNSVELNCYYPGSKQKITHLNSTYEIAVPNIILFIRLSRESEKLKVKQVNYFCTDLPSGDPSLHSNSFITASNHAKHIWILPFTNIYQDGKMCYGGNTTPISFSENLRGLDWYYQLLFNSPFNNDLGINSLANRHNPKDWYAKLSTFDTFPYEELRDYTGTQRGKLRTTTAANMVTPSRYPGTTDIEVEQNLDDMVGEDINLRDLIPF